VLGVSTRALPRSRSSQRGILLAAAASAAAFALMQAIVVPALPVLESDLGTTAAWATWTVSIYLLSASVATPLLGRLGDQFGKDRMLRVTLIVFVIGSIGAIFAWDISSLIVFRAIQGVGGAVYPLGFSILRDELPPERVPVGMGLVSAMLGVGGGVGVVMSGLIADHGSWRLLFVVGAGVGVLALGLVWRFVPPSPTRSPSRPDLVGAALLSTGLVALLVALTEGPHWGWASTEFLGLAVAGAVILVIWVLAERRIAQPMVDMRVMAKRPVLFTNLAALMTGFAMYVTFTLVPVFSQLPSNLPAPVQHLASYGLGATTTMAALYLLPGALAMLPAGPLAGVVGRRFGSRPALVGGLLITALGSATMAVWHTEPWQIIVTFAIGSIGVAAAFAAMPRLIVDAVSPTETGIATGMNTVVRTVGGVIGAQIGATLLAAMTVGPTEVPAESAFVTAFWLAAIAAVVGAGLALAIHPRRARATALAREEIPASG
jgi:EmrB/QacA subfamily drug resistance transporter